MRYLIYGLHYVEECFLYSHFAECFYHKWVLYIFLIVEHHVLYDIPLFIDILSPYRILGCFEIFIINSIAQNFQLGKSLHTFEIISLGHIPKGETTESSGLFYF